MPAGDDAGRGRVGAGAVRGDMEGWYPPELRSRPRETRRAGRGGRRALSEGGDHPSVAPKRTATDPTSASRSRQRGEAKGLAAVDGDVVLLDEAVDVVAVDAGLGGGARDVAAVAPEEVGEVVALEGLDEDALGFL